jgi:hypothetical protein
MEKWEQMLLFPMMLIFNGPGKNSRTSGKIDEGWDVVVASRHIKGGEVEKWSFYRKLNHWLANDFLRELLPG